MSTIQNLKNFIRHGKQARQAHGDPTTNVSPVHAQQQRYAPPPANAQYAMSDPNVLDHKPLQHANVPGGDYSVANIDNRNVVAQAGAAAARAAGDKQRVGDAGSVSRSGKETDPSVIERIVAEERESQGKLPKYPGLDRWTLMEKMGDGAFSNVYRAKEANGQGPEVAIKVVRKFEMNSTQVGLGSAPASLLSLVLHCNPRISNFLQRILYYDALPTSDGAIGRQPSTSGLQKATQGCGGAHGIPYTSATMHRCICHACRSTMNFY